MKFLLDTNVISELVRKRPSQRVLNQVKTHEREVAIPSIVWHELLYGLEGLPPSKRREQLGDFLWSVIHQTLPILPYDQAAAAWHAHERARLASLGFTPSFADGQIAAVAAVHGLTLITRNQTDFQRFEGLLLENWH